MSKQQNVSDLTSGFRQPRRSKLIRPVVVAVICIIAVMLLWRFGFPHIPFINAPGDPSRTDITAVTASAESERPALDDTVSKPTTTLTEDAAGWFSPAILLPLILLVTTLTLLTNAALLLLDLGWLAGRDKASRSGAPDARTLSTPALSQKDLQALRTEMEKSFRATIDEASTRLAQLIDRVRREPRVMGQEPPRGMARPPVEFAPPVPRPFDEYVRDYCQQSIGHSALIQAAQGRSLTWGTAQPMQGQRRVSVSLGRDDGSRILMFQRAEHASEYFVVLRDDAFWSFDLMLVFSGKAPDGGQPPDSRDTHAVTREPGIGRMGPGNEMTIEQPGLVEVS